MLLFSLQVDSAWLSGSHDVARRHAKTAKILNIIGIAIGSGIWAIIASFTLAQLILYFRVVNS